MTPDWQKIRKNYPATESYTYFNTASCGLISLATMNCSHSYQHLLGHQGSVYRDTLFDEMQKIKAVIGEFIHATPQDLALIPNFSSGMNYIVPMLQSLGSVLLIENDYPSLTLPWQLHNYEVHWLPQNPPQDLKSLIDLDQIAEKLRSQSIKILAISWVQYATGFIVAMKQLSKICKENNTLLVVDATQAIGGIPIDLEDTPVDILMCSCYKWATAGFGNGILYMHPDVVAQFETPVIGKGSTGLYESVYQPETMGLKARIFEIGHHNYGGFLVLSQTLSVLQQIGVHNIYERILALTQYFKERLPEQYTIISDYTPEQSTGIVAIKGGHSQVQEALKQEKIIVSARGEGLRISMHFYNTFEEVDHLLQVLEQLN